MKELKTTMTILLISTVLSSCQGDWTTSSSSNLDGIMTTLTDVSNKSNIAKPETESGIPLNFFIIDLIDPKRGSYPTAFFTHNLIETLASPLKLDEILNKNGVFHFASTDARASYSNIAVIKDGSMVLFKSLNCDNSGSTMEELLDYLAFNTSYDNKLLATLSQYRTHGVYVAIDPMSHVDCSLLGSGSKSR